MKKLVMILVPILVIGAVVGLALMGIINIPGLTPKKADWKATLTKIFKAHGSVKGDLVVLKDASKEDTDAFVAAAKAGGLDPAQGADGIKSPKLVALLTGTVGAAKANPKPKPPTPPTASKDSKVKTASVVKPEQGVKAIADLWNTIEVEKLVAIIAKYKDAELVKILLQMDQDHVSEFLAALPAEKAAKLSREIQKQASVVVSANSE